MHQKVTINEDYQTGQKENGTIAKAMIDVDWSEVNTDPELNYKWKLIPCIF